MDDVKIVEDNCRICKISLVNTTACIKLNIDGKLTKRFHNSVEYKATTTTTRVFKKKEAIRSNTNVKTVKKTLLIINNYTAL